jgi:hypothetical protein
MRRLLRHSVTVLLVLAACSGGDAGKADVGKNDAVKVAPKPAEAPAKDKLPLAEELLAKVVEASGGADKLDAIKSFSQEMTVEILGAGISGAGKTWSKGDDFFLEITLPGVGASSGGGKDGKMWTLDPIQGLRMLGGKEADVAAMGTSLNLAHDWRRFFDRAETTEIEEVDGKKFAEVVLTAASGNTVVLRIDLGDHRVVAQRLKQYSSMGEIPVEVTLSDYREQDGVWFAFTQIADMKLQKIKTTTTRLELNAEVDETRFAAPGSVPEAAPTEAPTEGKTAPVEDKKK